MNSGMRSESGEKLAILGAGSWGTAVAIALSLKFTEVSLWAHHDINLDTIRDGGENSLYLPGFQIPRNVHLSHDVAEVIEGAEIVLFSVPSQFARQVAQEAARFMKKGQIPVSLSKGVETETLKRVSEILQEVLPGEQRKHVSVLSGPTFAREVADFKPAAATVASGSWEITKKLQAKLSTPHFRLYADDDIVGVEMGGAVKNVIAIATGIADGLGFGLNARAAIVTRGLVEMKRLGAAFGAMRETFNGLAGLGDLILTCTGDLSRNRTFGLRLGRGESAEEILSGMVMIAEGVKTSLSIHEMKKKAVVEMPIAEQVYHILYGGKKPETAVRELLSRSLKLEKEGDS